MSTAYTLGNECAKNFCKRTVLVQHVSILTRDIDIHSKKELFNLNHI